MASQRERSRSPFINRADSLAALEDLGSLDADTQELPSSQPDTPALQLSWEDLQSELADVSQVAAGWLEAIEVSKYTQSLREDISELTFNASCQMSLISFDAPSETPEDTDQENLRKKIIRTIEQFKELRLTVEELLTPKKILKRNASDLD